MSEPSPVRERALTVISEFVSENVAKLTLDQEQTMEALSLSEDLNCDSLDKMELLMALEEEFGIEIDETAADEADTVGELLALVEGVTS